MNKRELKVLEAAFSQEIEAALDGGIRLYQTKSKLAEKLADEGYLNRTEIVFPGRFPVTLKGYMLTLLGNAAYCTSDLCLYSEDSE